MPVGPCAALLALLAAAAAQPCRPDAGATLPPQLAPEAVNPPPAAPLPPPAAPLPPAGLIAGPCPQAISFAQALARVAGQNPQVAFANEQVNVSFAQLRQAQVCWLPSIQAGVNYQNHDGPLQNSDGSITSASRSALEAGLGMYAVGGGAPAIPGLSARFAVADALFLPRAANQEVAAQQDAAAATTHDYLMMVAVAIWTCCGPTRNRPSPRTRWTTPSNWPP